MKKFDGVREKVFLDRYALKGAEGELLEHTPQEMWQRVAHGISLQEKKVKQKKWEKEFYRVLSDFKFVPGGRILSGAGTGYQVTYFNCFVIPNPKDSRHGILESLGQLIEIQSRSGGVGLNLSSLRPRGARVKKVNGTSSGPVNWATLFSVATHDIVQQGGSRRGATMLMLHDWHPDVEEFITVKQDLTKINGANLSVCVSDGFMEAVKNDEDWDLVYPELSDPHYDTEWDGDIIEWKKKGYKVKVYKTVKAKELWDLICSAAWRSAEPGLHFLERSNKRSNTWYFEKLLATNPCVTGDTLTATVDGWRRVDEIKVGDAINTVLGSGIVDRVEVYKKRPVFKVKFSDGADLRVTAAHQFHAIKHAGRAKNAANKRFSQLTLAELEVGDVVRVAPGSLPTNVTQDLPRGWNDKEYGFFIGMLLGDGCITEKSVNRNVVKVAINTDETEWVSLVRNVLQKTGANKVTLDASQNSRSGNFVIQAAGGAALLVKQSLLIPAYSYEKKIPLAYQNTNKEFLAGLLDGLFSTDGNIDLTSSHPFLRFKTTSKQLALDMRRILLCFGIHGRIATIKKVADSKIGDRVIIAKHQQYELIISGAGMKLFAEQIGLSHPDKQKRLQTARHEFALTGNTWLTKIISIEPDGVEDVYDLYESESDTWITEGIVSRGCGEQPLGGWAVCNLGAMNLAAYVRDDNLKEDKGGWFDYDAFGKDVQVAMRFLDNVIDDTYYFFKDNERVAKEIRRTGLGIMGIADTFIKMKIRYGSEESEKVSKKLFKTLRDNAYIASANLAKEKGVFPKFDQEKYLKGYHIKALPQEIRTTIAENGIRNAVLLTIAPTGTTSLLAGVSSGVEPVYEFEYSHNGRLGKQMVYHGLYGQWREAHPDVDRPDYFVGANDLTPEDHVKIQAIAQEYIDSSISKTVNAPNSHTVEDVKNLYMAAYDNGLKGVTYFRDGSRMGVLQREEKKEEKVEIAPALIEKPVVPITPRVARPMVLNGVTYKADSPTGKVYVTINNDEKGDMFEIFINHGKSGSDLMALADALGRMVSFVLRIHSPVPARERVREIVSELAGIGGSRSSGFGENRVRSLPDAISKVLARHAEFRVNGKVEDNAAYLERMSNGHSNGNGVANTNGHATVVEEETLTEVVPSQLALPQTGVSSTASTSLFDICPECGSGSFAYEEGCKKCYACAYSEC